ncbi:MAG TPA: hydantoinase/oxoprolinase family protein [Microbacterium sp.]|nr:hydantoinase/oxoprolinase family protein [Microbacterium sp.]
MPFIIGVDIGGTFTDAVAVDRETGRVATAKARSVPDDLVGSVMTALDTLAAECDCTTRELLSQTVKLAHGTTQTSNVMFTMNGGARTGLITTRGFGDELLMMRARGRVAGIGLNQRRHFRATNKPPQIVRRSQVKEVAERIDRDGNVLVPLDAASLHSAIDELVADGIEAIAVSLLWATANPVHELEVEEVIRQRAPHVATSVSHKLAPVTGEYERTATTVINAFVGKTFEKYIEKLEQALRENGYSRPLLLLQTSGGVLESAEILPINTIESGPAAGLLATQRIADALEERNLIATDVGGTTFKVGLLIDGEWSASPEMIINQYTILSPAMDVVSLGAGGGSVAWVDDTRLRVGPESAGGDPGPAAYGLGGDQATVTDADVVLGLISPAAFAAGEITLRPDLAHKAIKREVADRLFDGDAVAAAAGIRKVTDAQMGDLIKKMTIERGLNPADFTIVAYGGAGPLHAAGYALHAGVSTIVVPPSATVYSAFGAAASDIQYTQVGSPGSAFPANADAIHDLYNEMEARGGEALGRYGLEQAAVRYSRWADMRYERQFHDLRVRVGKGDADSTPLMEGGLMQEAFEERYCATYGTAARVFGAPIRVMRIGVDAVGEIDKPPLTQIDSGGPSPSKSAANPERDIYWVEVDAWLRSEVWNGMKFQAGNTVSGPALIELPATSIAVPPESTATVDAYGNFIIRLQARPH